MGLQWKKDETDETFYNGSTGNYIFFDADLGDSNENTDSEDSEDDSNNPDPDPDAQFDEGQADLDNFEDEEDFNMND